MVSTNEIEGIKVTVEVEASDTLAALLKGMRVEGAAPTQPVAAKLRTQTRAIVEGVDYLGGELALIEVDGVANAVQIRSKKAQPQHVEVILRGGNIITVDCKGGAVHISQDNLQKLTETLVDLVK
jgi:hypothetical protein